MNKIQFMLRSSILSFTVFFCLYSLTAQPVYAQKTSLIQSFWEQIFKLKPKSKSKPKPKPKPTPKPKPVDDPEPPVTKYPGTSRGPVCLVFPNGPSQTRIIWSTKPFFLWKGDIKKIAVGISNSQKDLETQIVSGTQSVNYTGQPLQPGQTYQWSVFLSELESASPAMFVPFKVMEAPQRNRVTAELRLLERSQKNNGADAEQIALTKAKYFAQKGLWSDALQQVYSVPNPSPELSQMIEELPNHLCKPSSVNVGRSRSR